jgi:hypothetical protein
MKQDSDPGDVAIGPIEQPSNPNVDACHRLPHPSSSVDVHINRVILPEFRRFPFV